MPSEGCRFRAAPLAPDRAAGRAAAVFLVDAGGRMG